VSFHGNKQSVCSKSDECNQRKKEIVFARPPLTLFSNTSLSMVVLPAPRKPESREMGILGCETPFDAIVRVESQKPREHAMEQAHAKNTKIKKGTLNCGQQDVDRNRRCYPFTETCSCCWIQDAEAEWGMYVPDPLQEGLWLSSRGHQAKASSAWIQFFQRLFEKQQEKNVSETLKELHPSQRQGSCMSWNLSMPSMMAETKK
jgi:hypothetical protein